VFGVVDAYDAMTSKRPYRPAMSREEACAEVAGHSGTQFDPVVVEAFLAMIVKAPEGVYEENDPYGPTTHTHDHDHNEEHIAVLGA
jgi:HD-GYP domain-containing protein (c-di-GMP phosphodiesterase class II)